MSEYKPFHLDIKKVKLQENNPTDDYQRLYFNSLIKQNLHDLTCKISEVDYKSNIVNVFNHPPWLNDIENPKEPVKGRGWNNLCCYEYQLPDVLGKDTSTNQPNLIDTTQFVIQGSIKVNDNTQQSSISSARKKSASSASSTATTNAAVIPTNSKNNKEKLVITKANKNNSNSKPNNEPIDPKGLKSIYDLNIKTGNISLSTNQNLTSLKDTFDINSLPDNNSTLTKNQQFKLTKLNYNSNGHSNLINPNNCILWDKNSGFVFLTGIWRLYQDIMNGLGTMERVSTVDGSHISTSPQLQDHCKKEMDYILNYAFYEPISWDGKQTRRRKSSITNSNDIQAHNNEIKSPEDIHYVDLHWNSLSKDLKHLVLSDFQETLEKQYPGKTFDDLDMSTHILQRIRGGYIKIQGTWLPWQVARLICTRFCFPIRWLLVPMFGPTFPQECEDYYFNIMLKNMKYIKQNATFVKNQEGSNKKTSTGKTRRHTYGGISSSSKTNFPRQRRKRHSTTNISPPVSPTATQELSPKSRKFDMKTSPLNLNFPPQQQTLQQLPPHTFPNVVRRRSKSDFGINPNINFNPLVNTGTQRPSTLPPITSVFEQINPYDVPFLAAANNLINVNNSSQPFMTRPRLNSLPCPGVTNSNKLYNENNPYPTVSTLSNLATFYNTRGHKYSYPKNFIQPTVLTSGGTNDNMKFNFAATSNVTSGANPNFTSFGFLNSQSRNGSNGLNYQWATGVNAYQESLPRSKEINYKENEPVKKESKRIQAKQNKKKHRTVLSSTK
ncbi:hypothetical protein MOUN0_I04236 [Monosporozyma unispora]|nr:hypothetical protein C6P44_004046 [Kazachstania unispora]